MDKRKPKVAALVRVSTREQAGDDRAGIARQREVNARTIKFKKLECVDEVEINDVSGTNVRNCPEVLQLLDRIAGGQLQGLVVADLDRLIRPDNIEDMALLQVFQSTGAILYCGDQDIDLSSDSGYLLGGMQALLAGHELRLIKKRMLGAKEEKRRQGKCPGSQLTLPLGVTYNRGVEKYEYTPEVSRVIEAFRLVDEAGITNLSEVGRRTGIQARTLANTLRNRVYAGWRVYDNKRGEKYPGKNGRQQGRKKVRRADDEIIRVRVFDAPAVSEESFERVQRILEAKHSSWRRRRHTDPSVNLATGIARCAICSSPIYCSSAKRQTRTSHGYYFCRANYYLNRNKTGGCSLKNIRQDQLDADIVEFTSTLLADRQVVEGIIRHAIKARDEETKRQYRQGGDKAVAELIAEAEVKCQRILTAYEDGAIPLGVFKQRSVAIDDDIRRLRLLEDKAKHRQATESSVQQVIRQIVRGAAAFSRISSPGDQKTVLEQMFAEIRIKDAGIVGFRLMPQFDVFVCETGTRTDRGSWRQPA